MSNNKTVAYVIGGTTGIGNAAAAGYTRANRGT